MQTCRSALTLLVLGAFALSVGACKSQSTSAASVTPAPRVAVVDTATTKSRSRIRLPASVPAAELDSAELLIRAMQRRVTEADQARARRDTAQELDCLELALSMGDPNANPAWVGRAMSMNGLSYADLQRRAGQLLRFRRVQAK